MTTVFLLFFVVTYSAANDLAPTQNATSCEPKHLSESRSPPRLRLDLPIEMNKIVKEMEKNSSSFSSIAQQVLSTHHEVIGAILWSSKRHPILSLNLRDRLKVFPNRTNESEMFWKVFDSETQGWTTPFRECRLFKGTWFYAYVLKSPDVGVVLFVPIVLNQCDYDLAEIFGGATHRCDEETTECFPRPEYGERRGGYYCVCRRGYFFPSANLTWRGFPGDEIENGLANSYRCVRCPNGCEICEKNGQCRVGKDFYLKTIILSVQVFCMFMTVIVGLVVLKQRKCKAIACAMWKVLETILFGILILHSTVIIQYFEPSLLQCFLERWTREIGFIICYGGIILKLYRHLIEFRTRKAHRWIIKDTDLLKYLFIMFISVFAYMAAYTAITLNFVQESYSILAKRTTSEGIHYETCKYLWWDYVTQIGELAILTFGIHVCYTTRNAKTQFHERSYLCTAISIELAVSGIFYMARIIVLPDLHPNFVLVAHFMRIQLTASVTLILIFVPKFWYTQKQIRSLAQDYSCRLPMDAFKDINSHGPLSSNNSDADVGEVTLADMNPEDIRAELKRLYIQLEVLKNKTIRLDNPHISKRRGGRKAPHRRFSLQKKGSRERNLYGNKHRVQKKQEEEITEIEPSRTPEESVCSNEGPSTVYQELSIANTKENQQ